MRLSRYLLFLYGTLLRTFMFFSRPLNGLFLIPGIILFNALVLHFKGFPINRFFIIETLKGTAFVFSFVFVIVRGSYRKLNGTTTVFRWKNEFQMSLKFSPNLLKRHPGSNRADVLITQLIDGLRVYCNKPSIFKRPLYIRTNQFVIDSFKERFPTINFDFGEPVFKMNLYRLVYLSPFDVFKERKYRKITEKSAHYKFNIPHKELMKLKPYLERRYS